MSTARRSWIQSSSGWMSKSKQVMVYMQNAMRHRKLTPGIALRYLANMNGQTFQPLVVLSWYGHSNDSGICCGNAGMDVYLLLNRGRQIMKHLLVQQLNKKKQSLENWVCDPI